MQKTEEKFKTAKVMDVILTNERDKLEEMKKVLQKEIAEEKRVR